MNMLRSLFGLGPTVDIAELLEQGATIVDVRSKGEYAGGHANGSINIPLDTVLKSLNKIPKDKPVITCCASGMRSGAAADQLKSHGYEAYNGGPWTQVQAALVK